MLLLLLSTPFLLTVFFNAKKRGGLLQQLFLGGHRTWSAVVCLVYISQSSHNPLSTATTSPAVMYGFGVRVFVGVVGFESYIAWFGGGAYPIYIYVHVRLEQKGTF